MTISTLSAMKAPTIPLAESDGLIKTLDLKSGIPVYLTPYSPTDRNDCIELLINGIGTGITKTVSDLNASENMKIIMDLESAHFPKDGDYAIGYRLITFPGALSTQSATAKIRIDRAAPGAALLAPIIFHQVNFGEALKGMLPGYADMQAGDCIQTFCNNREGPVHVVEPENLATVPMQIVFSKAFLLGLDSQHVTINYQVIDRAGNVSLLSHSVTLSMQF
ncbi:hypothetical protein [Pseudomonas syringae]|uniref:hypothetical protein n=1 Tax=Pseudomonas syringae TaxID=317 RepID=UPI0018E5CFF8|nr:hypothetical protein [Pseudomonas syringae]MBI6799271.1 hypothetical protein [Pseudomonas syringae]MDC3741022.1 hypothetical protein [Pseudomonas syringae pv. syringae]QVK30662.1 hypothetical protein KIJ28_16265 [Pseudomonas syringae]UZS66120.1 hypothetical protein OQB65_17265 [Pseudomonas syringae]